MNTGVIASSRRRSSTPTYTAPTWVGRSGAGVATAIANVPVTGLAAGAVGDYQFAHCCSNNLTSTWNVPSGWATWATASGQALLYKIATATTEADTTFTRVGTTAAAVVVVSRWAGVGGITGTPGFWNGTGTDVTLPTVTSMTPNSRIAQMVTRVNSGATSWTGPTGEEEYDGVHNNFTAAGGSLVLASIGPSGTKLWVHGATGPTRGVIFPLDGVLAA